MNKAGRTLRRAQHGELFELEVVRQAIRTLVQYRALHQYPLQKATMGLRSMVKTEGCRVDVSQRLKRVPTMLDKLAREPTMQLANMQDIGGCRAVLTTVPDVRRVQRRLSKRRPVLRLNDYIATPRESGYRGVHVIVEYDERQIEVQLRTFVMHEWAVTVERLSGRLREDLKSGVGPPPVLDLLKTISKAMEVEEAGETVDASLLVAMTELRVKALPWLTGGPQ